MPSYRFFFSYASETYRASKWDNWGQTGNHLDAFYDALCRAVAMETGQKIEDVAYRDQQRLTVASFWRRELATSLQSSSVLIAMVSPHYLKSKNCGREVEFFRERFRIRPKPLPGMAEAHRIVPVFWMDKATCSEHMAPPVQQLFHDLQLTGAGMPETYPHTGALRLYTAGDPSARSRLVEHLARTIKRLSEMPQLPQLPGAGDFEQLPSFFTRVPVPPASPIAIGPKRTNVVYAVATATEAKQGNLGDEDRRSEQREGWRPFIDANGATVEMAIREGLNGAGQDDAGYRSLGIPADLTPRIEEAHRANCPVLIVLDRSSLKISTIAEPLHVYDGRDFPNVGMVTAGGQDADEPLVDKVLPTKFRQKRPNHLWTVPSGRTPFVQSVVEVIGGLRRCLQQTGATAVNMPAGQMPGL